MMRGDAELASAMRKLLANDEVYVSTSGPTMGVCQVTVDGSASITEEEMQVIEELMDR